MRMQVYRLLEECGDEFVPALSQRESTVQSDWMIQHFRSSVGVKSYFESMSRQSFLLASSLEYSRLLAFLSYVPDYHIPYGVMDTKSLYVSTVCTAHAVRGLGIARSLYLALESLKGTETISIRTWSTNVAQVHLLGSLGYREIFRIPNDCGQGIDTIYFVKEIC
jgi:ribosomal protein S18 acetylase RimI-like enzyme